MRLWRSSVHVNVLVRGLHINRGHLSRSLPLRSFHLVAGEDLRSSSLIGRTRARALSTKGSGDETMRTFKRGAVESGPKGMVNEEERKEERIGEDESIVQDTEEDDDEDEYGNVDSIGETYICPSHTLMDGTVLKDVQVRYKTYGKLNAQGTNCLVVCHALTGNAALDEWWGDMLGEGKLFDDTKMFIVCANVLGSCYGTTGPITVNPETNKPYGSTFPKVTVRDSVSLHIKLVREHLKVNQVACVIGGSLGGMQTLEWAALGGPDFVKAIIPMCCGAYHHAWQVAISHSQRMAIYADPDWNDGTYLENNTKPPEHGLGVARAIAMFTYRSHRAYTRKFGRRTIEQTKKRTNGKNFQAESYLEHQGDKFNKRFDALSYVRLTQLMDSHDLGHGRPGGVENVLKNQITQPTLIISVESDILYPPVEQRYLHEMIPNSKLLTLESDHGHDGFLLDQDLIMPVAKKFLEEHVYSKIQLPDHSKL